MKHKTREVLPVFYFASKFICNCTRVSAGCCADISQNFPSFSSDFLPPTMELDHLLRYRIQFRVCIPSDGAAVVRRHSPSVTFALLSVKVN